MKIKLICLISFFLLLNINPVLAIKEIKTNCELIDCYTELDMSDIKPIDLLPYKSDLNNFLIKEKAFSLSKEINNSIIFTNISWLGSIVTIKGKIQAGTQNYWGIKNIWNSTWWNSSLPMKKNITANNSLNSANLDDYEWFVNVTNKTNMKTDCGDVRFIFNNTEQNYCLKRITTSFCEFWVLIDIAGYEQKIYEMYYNNSNLTTTSNCNKVFKLYDDFQDNSLNTSKWSCYASSGTPNCTEANNIMNISGTSGKVAYIKTTTSFNFPYIVEYLQKSTLLSVSNFLYGWDGTVIDSNQNPNIAYRVYLCHWCSPKELDEVEYTSGGSSAGDKGGCYWNNNGEWIIWKHITKSANTTHYHNTTFLWSNSDGTLTSGYLGFGGDNGLFASYDNITIRSFTEPEPTFQFGEEEYYYAPPPPPPISYENTTYISYYCSGNSSIKNVTLTQNNISNSTYTVFLCENGCNENNLILNDNKCNPTEWLQWVLYLALVFVILLIGYKVMK